MGGDYRHAFEGGVKGVFLDDCVRLCKSWFGVGEFVRKDRER